MTGEGMVAALTWMAPPIHPYPMPNSVTDLTAEILQTEVILTKDLHMSVPYEAEGVV